MYEIGVKLIKYLLSLILSLSCLIFLVLNSYPREFFLSGKSIMYLFIN